jgi:hypothetical protein
MGISATISFSLGSERGGREIESVDVYIYNYEKLSCGTNHKRI